MTFEFRKNRLILHLCLQVETIRVVLKKELDLPIIEISDSKAKLDGGDVLFTGKRNQNHPI